MKIGWFNCAAVCLLAGCISTGGSTEYTLDSGGAMAPDQAAVVFDKADLQFRIDPARETLEGVATLDLIARTPLLRAHFDLDRTLPIRAVAVDGGPLPSASFANPDGRLVITLPRVVPAGQRVSIEIRYGGHPHVAKKAPWDGGFVWAETTGDHAPWVATAVEGEGCDLFWPCIDHPMGEPREVVQHVTVPAPLVAAGNGVFEGVQEANGWRTYHFRIKRPNTYAIALNIGPFKLLAADYKSHFGNTVPLRFWYLKEHEANAKALFAEFPRMLDFLEGAIGPYPFGDEQMGVVETPHKGMEHQTINAYGNEYAKEPYGYDGLLQHEFTHEWFGNQLTNADWDDMWLHEGFASYMQPLYARYLYGEMPYLAALHAQRLTVKNAFPIVSDKPRRENQVYDDKAGPGGDIYTKGSLVLHSLRLLIGDDAFFECTRRLVYGRPDPRPGNFVPRYGTTKEFIAIVNTVTGRELGWFFEVYLYQAALPELVETRTGDQLTLEWRTARARPFPMPVEVRVGDRIETLPMTNGKGSITAPVGALVTLDPESKVLRRLPHVEAYQAYLKARKKAESERSKPEGAGIQRNGGSRGRAGEKR